MGAVLFVLLLVFAVAFAYVRMRSRGLRDEWSGALAKPRTSVRTVLDVRLDGPRDEAARAQARRQLDTELDKLGIDRVELDARIDRGDDHVRIERDGDAFLGGIAKLASSRVRTVVNVELQGGPMSPEARAKLDAELDKLGIDRTEIDAKLDAGETHIHVERDRPGL